MTLTVQDLLTIRKLQSIADAQRFLAEREVPVGEWHRYLSLVATSPTNNNDIQIKAIDPLRHWCWALLILNGATYRQISQYYSVAASSVHVGVSKHLTKVQRAWRMPKCSLEFLEQLVKAFALHREQVCDTSVDPFTAAQRLNELAKELGD